MRIVYTDDAEADFGEIGDYISRDDAQQARRFLAELLAFIERISEAPHTYRLRTEWMGQVRAARYGTYLVIFEIEGEDMLVLRIVNGRRNIAKLLAARYQ